AFRAPGALAPAVPLRRGDAARDAAGVHAGTHSLGRWSRGGGMVGRAHGAEVVRQVAGEVERGERGRSAPGPGARCASLHVGAQAERRMDGLPVALDEVIDRYGPRYFKLKLCGTLRDDIERLAQIAVVLATLPAYAVTLDGNEQFADGRAVAEFWRAYGADPRLMRLGSATLYLERPLPRQVALACDVRG